MIIFSYLLNSLMVEAKILRKKYKSLKRRGWACFMVGAPQALLTLRVVKGSGV